MRIEHRIVVLGAGYTGMMCAIRLARRTRRGGAAITVVNPSDRFTERLRMHQVAAAQELAVHRIPDLLAGTGITFLRGRAVAIDPERREVAIDGSRSIAYDTLVYALGSSADTRAVPGADRHAYTLDDPRTAGRFATRLGELAATGGAVTVCGAGLTGVEAAAEIAESHPGLRVTLIGRHEPGAMMGAKGRAYLHRSLERLGVTLRVGAAITKVLPDAVELAGGESVPSDACLWTTGVRVSPLAAEAGIAVDEHGLIVVDATLRSRSHPEIHAIGDAAAVHQAWGRIHGTCQSGMPTAAHTADVIARQLRGKAGKPFRFGYVHQPVSLGRHDAVIQFTHADDTPRRWCLTGKRAVAYKEMVSGSPLKAYRLSKRVTVGMSLSKGGRATRKAA
ncbi:NAD(P)/FAD-dependent oxidoreductase [Embleya sp. NBC_00896]|uniref:NAD(P)/FAD-dependent oxidoreductase n=1 Tax=Embleya sp. NBC_00896 TaxID=2975961 RepID=UPI00386D3810|nr:FAD-dependent oxidoreductase [Embleya sp. NBC_00896]